MSNMDSYDAERLCEEVVGVTDSLRRNERRATEDGKTTVAGAYRHARRLLTHTAEGIAQDYLEEQGIPAPTEEGSA